MAGHHHQRLLQQLQHRRRHRGSPPAGAVSGVGVGTTTVRSELEWSRPLRIDPSYCISFSIGDDTPTDVLSLSVSISPATVQPAGQTTVTVTVLPALAGRSVNLSVQEVPSSGGHLHLGRPLGTLGASSGTTDAQGKFTTTYTASQFGGAETLTASSGPASGSSPTLIVQWLGLSPLSDGANYDLVGATSTHPVNHYGNATANSNLPTIANQYAAQFAGSILLYNDISLVRGDLFDIGPEPSCPGCVLWQTPHVEHRLGANCDVSKSNVPSGRWDTLEGIFLDNNATFLEESNHWHLRF